MTPFANGRNRGMGIDWINKIRRRFLRAEPPLPINRINNTSAVVFVDVGVCRTVASAELFVVVDAVTNVDLRPTYLHLSAQNCTRNNNQKRLMSAHCCIYQQCQRNILTDMIWTMVAEQKLTNRNVLTRLLFVFICDFAQCFAIWTEPSSDRELAMIEPCVTRSAHTAV